MLEVKDDVWVCFALNIIPRDGFLVKIHTGKLLKA